MGSMWRKAKRAMGFNLCVHVPRAMGEEEEEEDDGCRLAWPGSGRRASDAAATAMSSPAGSSGASEFLALMPSTPTPSSGGLRLPKSGIRSSKVGFFVHISCFLVFWLRG